MRTACAPAPALRRTWWRWSWRNRQRAYGRSENIAAMSVVAEHVETRACRRQQHGIARRGSAMRGRYRLLHRCHDLRGTHSMKRGGDIRRVLADQQGDAHLAAKRGGEGREVLTLSLTPGDHQQRSPQARNRGAGGTHIRALGIIDVAHTADIGDP